MTLKVKCPCGHVFTFDTEKVSTIRELVESQHARAGPPLKYLPKCPKCAKELEVSHPNK